MPDPEFPRFSQTWINKNFNSSEKGFGGMSRSAMVKGLQDGSIDPKSLRVEFIESNGYTVVDNNRSAASLIEAGIPESKWNLVPASDRASKAIQTKLNNNNLPPSGTAKILDGKPSA